MPWAGMRMLAPLLLVSLLVLAFAVRTAGSSPSDRPVPAPAPGPTRPAPGPSPRLACERPRTLFLRRFEDRSARLECAGRILVRVSVPG